MLRDYEKGDMVRYAQASAKHNGPSFNQRRHHFRPGLVVDAEYHVKSNDFLIFIMWPDAQSPQALFQKDCHNRGLEVIS
jgi:hypothetical protein